MNGPLRETSASILLAVVFADIDTQRCDKPRINVAISVLEISALV